MFSGWHPLFVLSPAYEELAEELHAVDVGSKEVTKRAATTVFWDQVLPSHMRGINSVAWKASQESVVFFGCEDGTLRRWNLSQEVVEVVATVEQSYYVNLVECSPCGRYVAFYAWSEEVGVDVDYWFCVVDTRDNRTDEFVYELQVERRGIGGPKEFAWSHGGERPGYTSRLRTASAPEPLSAEGSEPLQDFCCYTMVSTS